MSQVIIGKWGKNLAIRFPGEIVKAAGLSDGERVEIETTDATIVIRRAVPHFTLEELTSHIRSIDTKARPIRYAGAAVPAEIASLVRAKLNAFITI